MDIKTLCLGVVCGMPSSGYEIRKVFEESPMRHFCDPSFGSIYPALRKLSDDGLIEETEAENESGRSDRKIFQITDQGSKALAAALMEPIQPDKFRSDFMFVMAFAEMLPPEHIDRVIDQQIERVRQEMKMCASLCECEKKQPGSKFIHGLGMLMYRTKIEYLEKEREQLAKDLRAAQRTTKNKNAPVITGQANGKENQEF